MEHRHLPDRKGARTSEASVKGFDKFADQCRSAVSQQLAGHTEAFQDLWSHADDVVLMGAAGSHAVGLPAIFELPHPRSLKFPTLSA
jgi:hypothetical protein